ncbi:DNA-directed DNA polymerase [Halalkalicoccus jeotgali]|uniref:DNA polymerase n=1 Tax=Halalkalicoccus jeotgali (strain DSM 18796 / CECT 7217 / JCM 14584 / KCTC 4019 / B3) TaxID=795797 RepID=D8J698_HALJB|nr:DNA polymerase elongation subunit [Halalkalicoccus jeotgali]ADJ15816.1 DNA-directed DNA polymerase type II [Halalkalicoccus jeotgali B3]ELY38285.1 DNA-directed DNA polymerase type II [Halalkalicoccus jeotgali B3]
MEQSGLSAYADADESEGRPAAEARAVAGNGDTTGEVVDIDERRFPPVEETVDLGVTQVNYTVEEGADGEYPVVHVFGRDDAGEAHHVRIYEFRPYFYAPSASLTDEDLSDSRITGTEEGYESIRGEKLTRIFGQTPRDVGNMRDRFDHYEADILFPNRLLIDKGINSGIRVPDRRDDDGSVRVHHEEIEPVEAEADLRVHNFDIEVDDRSGFPEEGEEPIVCLTSHDSTREEYIGWLYVAPAGDGTSPADLPDYAPISEDVEIEIHAFESEEAMLDAYLSYITETDPDVLTGWNVDDFDAPYLIDRLDRLDPATDYDLSMERLSRVNEVWRSDWQGPNIKGRVVFDLLYAYKRTQFTELDSYRLDAVAETELGVGKERYAGDIGDLWEQDPERLLEYNVRDVELCVEIDARQGIIPFWDEVRTFVGCKLEDAPTPGDTVDMYVLHKVHGEFALPSKGRVDSEEYEGGAVFDPITGVKENVTVLDLKSLYPMCMVTINASPETKAEPDYEGETYRAPNGMEFKRQPDGIIRSMVDELLTERDRKKSRRAEHSPGSGEYERFDRQQGAVKVIMNSLYGVLGWERFRLYDKDVAGAVTATGRDVIEFTEESANELGYQVTYGDTDSVMLELGAGVDRQSAIEQSFEIEKHINGSYDEFASEVLDAEDHRFQIEFEKLYRRFFQAGRKKRYAGHIIWKEGKDVDDIDITGFEYKRSDIAPITKEVQKDVIEMIVLGEDLEEVKSYVHDVVTDFQEGEIDLDRIAVPGGIGKRLDNYDTDTAQVRGAKYANLLLGTNFTRGSKPKRLYLRKVHPKFFRRMENERGLDPQRDRLYAEFKRDPDVICFEYEDQLPEEFEVDWEKMLEKTLKGPISRVLEALDISWDEVKSGQQQTGLGSFM